MTLRMLYNKGIVNSLIFIAEIEMGMRPLLFLHLIILAVMFVLILKYQQSQYHQICGRMIQYKIIISLILLLLTMIPMVIVNYLTKMSLLSNFHCCLHFHLVVDSVLNCFFCRFDANDYVVYVMGLGQALYTSDIFFVDSDINNKSNYRAEIFSAFSVYSSLSADPYLVSSTPHPLKFSSRGNSEDNPTYIRSIKSTDREQFVEEMTKDMDQLAIRNAFIAVLWQKEIDMGMKVIECVWTFKRKRYPYVSLKNHKARLLC